MLAICAALRWEIRPILRAVGDVKRMRCGAIGLWTSTRRPQTIVIFRTGIGYASADRATRRVLEALPIRTIINTGCAGALTSALGPGAVVIPRMIFYPDAQTHEVDAICARRLSSAARRAQLPFDEGPILSSSSVLATALAKNVAHTRFGATAVEMEGHAVASVAREHSVRFGSARAILDSADLDLPEEHPGAVIDLALRSAGTPEQLPSIEPLANAVNAAQTSLEQLFRQFLTGSPAD